MGKAKKSWVDFAEVKDKVSIKQVLEHYGLLESLHEQGDRLVGVCPIHRGSNTRQFSVSLEKNVFHCFSGHCGAKGNVLDLVAALEDCSIREAALKVAEWFEIVSAKPAAGKAKKKEAETSGKAKSRGVAQKKEASEDRESESKEASEESEATGTNKPLTFELKLEPKHPYLESRGLTQETVTFFGLGLASKGVMKGRIAIPIYDEQGQLVGYAGRWAGKDEEIPEGEGKYKLPPNFHKAAVVYNLHRVPEGTKRVIVVEGFFSVFWLQQCGYPNVVSLMGSSCSPAQAELLCQRSKGVELLLDGDEAGRRGAEKIAGQLAKRIWVRNHELAEGKQPDQRTPAELKQLLA